MQAGFNEILFYLYLNLPNMHHSLFWHHWLWLRKQMT